MNITHWVPAADSPRWPCVTAWLDMQLPEGATKTFVRSGANNVRYSWNKIIVDFLASKSEWLFSTHNDVTFVPGTLNRLLSWDCPLISALIFMRTNPILPHIWKAYPDKPEHYAHRINDTREWFTDHKEWIKFGPFLIDPRPEDALVEIDFTSTSCTLIHRSVLEAMRPAVADQWFLWDDDYNGGGEDRRFFETARKVGYPAYVDRSCIVGHLVGDVPTSAAEFIMWDSVSQFNGTGEE